MDDNKKFSIVDVAIRAGVSTATVSRVINHNGGYSKETEVKVRQMIHECEFTPNVNAIGLRTNQSKCIGVIVPDVTNEFFARIIQELDCYFLRHRYSLLICNSNEDYDLERMHIKGLVQKQVDGIVYISGQNEIKNMNKVSHIPVVYIDRAPRNARMLILSDNREGGCLAVRELLDKGCSRILLLRDIRGASTVRCRREGYLKALGERGIPYQEELEVKCFPEYAGAHRVMEHLLKNQGCFFDGIFATNDMMALACVNVLMESGIKIPGDVKIVGFDNISLTRFTNPRITTISQDTRQMALAAGRTILGMIQKKEIKDTRTIIPVTLEVRETT